MTTVAEGDTYFGGRLNADDWTNAASDEKTKALKTAEHLLKPLNYKGKKKDSAQDDPFPRGTDTVVPASIKEAVFEIAIRLLEGYDVEMERESMNVTSSNVAGLHARKDARVQHPAFIHGIPSTVAWSLLLPYLRQDRTVKLIRVTA